MEGVSPLTVDRDEALKLYRKYLSHRNHQSPLDADIARIYKAMSQGKVIVPAIASTIKAGLGPDGYPKLGIARADAKILWLETTSNGGCTMSDERWLRGNTAKSRYVQFPQGSFPGIRGSASALVPHIPPDIRPKRGIENYSILFEAVWRHEAPVDPMLLRRLSGDMWVMVAAWDLTDVERAVMMEHFNRVRN